jgi:hypothetical protein
MLETGSVERFLDRLAVASLHHDDPVHVFSPEAETEAWIPEPLFQRMQGIAAAYRLHVVPLLSPDALWALSGQQAESLGDELAFLAEVTNDPPLHEQLAAIMRVLNAGMQAGAETAVAFEWPSGTKGLST